MPLLEELSALLLPEGLLLFHLIKKSLHLCVIPLSQLFELEPGRRRYAVLPLSLRLLHHHVELFASVRLRAYGPLALLDFRKPLHVRVIVLPSIAQLIKDLKVLHEVVDIVLTIVMSVDIFM